MNLHIATSRPIGEKCKEWAYSQGYTLTGIDECEVFISVMYDTIIKEEYIKKHRCYNFHPGVLPEYRGAGAYSWVLLNEEEETGVTLHEIDKDIDHGDIIEIAKFPIEPNDTAGDLFAKAEDVMFSMFKDWLPKLLDNDYETFKVGKGKIYYRKDLEKAKDITRIKKAFTFPGKESAYYWDSGVKIYI